MLYTEFDDLRHFGSRESRFLRFSPHHIWMWTSFSSPVTKRPSVKFGFRWPSEFALDPVKLVKAFSSLLPFQGDNSP